MFTLTSTNAKLAILAFSAVVSAASFQTVAVGFQSRANAVNVVELPTVVVIGYRAALTTDLAQSATKLSTKSAS